MQALAFALAGCMAMDVVHILRKGRYDLHGLEGRPRRAQRAPDEPHRFTGVALHFTVTGDVPDDQVERAIDLSRDKYCSVVALDARRTSSSRDVHGDARSDARRPMRGPRVRACHDPRRGYLDWIRGIAVLIMIEAHVIDSWTRLPTAQPRRSSGR